MNDLECGESHGLDTCNVVRSGVVLKRDTYISNKASIGFPCSQAENYLLRNNLLLRSPKPSNNQLINLFNMREGEFYLIGGLITKKKL